MNQTGRPPLTITRLTPAVLLPIYLLILMPVFATAEAQTTNTFSGITTNIPPQAPVVQSEIVQAQALAVSPLVVPVNPNPPPYSNSGDNTTGFVVRSGGPNISSDGSVINCTVGGGWDAIPVEVSGNFKIEFDVINNSFDGDSHIFLVDDTTNAGVDVVNSPQGTDTPNINVLYSNNFGDSGAYYFPPHTLASQNSTAFPNMTWTHVIISKNGNILTDNVGGQIMTADVSNIYFPPLARVGLGYYATTYRGGAGNIKYRNIVITEEAPVLIKIGSDVGEGYENTFVNHDDIANTKSEHLYTDEVVFGGKYNGDKVDYQAYVPDENERKLATSYTWAATGPVKETGPSGATATHWTISDPDTLKWPLGDYTITLDMTFSDGSTGHAEYAQHIASRAVDAVIIGWIDPNNVTVNPAGVTQDVTDTLPPQGFASYRTVPPAPGVLVLQAFAAGWIGRLAAGSATEPSDITKKLTAADKAYILNWLFKYASNSKPASSYTQTALETFRTSGLGYKLYNRFQIRYDIADGDDYLTQAVILHKDAMVGITTDPIFGLPVPGQAGPNQDAIIKSHNDAFHVNEADPDPPAVSAFNTLVSPKNWNHIGSSIEEGVNTNYIYNFLTQVYPTYYVYERDATGTFTLQSNLTVPQAPDPVANCTAAPSSPYIPTAP